MRFFAKAFRKQLRYVPDPRYHLGTFLCLVLTTYERTGRKNFLALCASNYYDDSPFHRLIPSFMVQTGAPAHPSPENPKGGRSIFGPTFEDEIRGTLRHNERGIVSMANRGPGTNGSQFFILLDKAPHLDGLNTVFGKLLGDDSLRTLALIEQIEVDKKNRPTESIRIERVTMHANPLAA